MTTAIRVLLIDPNEGRREMLAQRLRAQGWSVDATSDAAIGADLALRAPPSAVVADLWMPGISGVQLCRLLRAEAATADVPVILCGDGDEPRHRFWAERAGAAAYIVNGRTGELVRALVRATDRVVKTDEFFVQLSGGSTDVRDRLARHLDAALFESVVASELRALASAEGFERLFDRFAQLLSQMTRYRWIALTSPSSDRVALHCHPTLRAAAEQEVRAAMRLPEGMAVAAIEDEDADNEDLGTEPIVCDVKFARSSMAQFACSPTLAREHEMHTLAGIVGRELGSALKIVTLVEDTRRMAAIDVLTSVMTRRAFTTAVEIELSRSVRHGYPFSLLLLDVDHFKNVNDSHGHSAGDRVLSAIGELLRKQLRLADLITRWGGEEFVVGCTSTPADGALVTAERLRVAIEKLVVLSDHGERIPVTGSIGCATWRGGESIASLVDRADRAMYRAKTTGRNRVEIWKDEEAAVESCPPVRHDDDAGRKAKAGGSGSRADGSSERKRRPDETPSGSPTAAVPE
jgi:two-component system cell cycle response regulator